MPSPTKYPKYHDVMFSPFKPVQEYLSNRRRKYFGVLCIEFVSRQGRPGVTVIARQKDMPSQSNGVPRDTGTKFECEEWWSSLECRSSVRNRTTPP